MFVEGNSMPGPECNQHLNVISQSCWSPRVHHKISLKDMASLTSLEFGHELSKYVSAPSSIAKNHPHPHVPLPPGESSPKKKKSDFLGNQWINSIPALYAPHLVDTGFLLLPQYKRLAFLHTEHADPGMGILQQHLQLVLVITKQNLSG